MHPHLLEFLRLYKYNAQTVIEGMLFGDSRQHDAVRIMGLCNPCNALGDIANIPATTYWYKYIGSLQHYNDKRDTIVKYVSQKVSGGQHLKWFVEDRIRIHEDIRTFCWHQPPSHELQELTAQLTLVTWHQDDRGVTNNNASNATTNE